jgi:hypothetical protein
MNDNVLALFKKKRVEAAHVFPEPEKVAKQCLALKHGEHTHKSCGGKASILFHSLPHASACGLLALLALLLLRSVCERTLASRSGRADCPSGLSSKHKELSIQLRSEVEVEVRSDWKLSLLMSPVSPAAAL